MQAVVGSAFHAWTSMEVTEALWCTEGTSAQGHVCAATGAGHALRHWATEVQKEMERQELQAHGSLPGGTEPIPHGHTAGRDEAPFTAGLLPSCYQRLRLLIRIPLFLSHSELPGKGQQR